MNQKIYDLQFKIDFINYVIIPHEKAHKNRETVLWKLQATKQQHQHRINLINAKHLDDEEVNDWRSQLHLIFTSSLSLPSELVSTKFVSPFQILPR
jgi:hypothetical protein